MIDVFLTYYRVQRLEMDHQRGLIGVSRELKEALRLLVVRLFFTLVHMLIELLRYQEWSTEHGWNILLADCSFWT